MQLRVLDHTGEKYSREVRIITADFSKGLGIYPNLGEQLKDLDIGILGECMIFKHISQ